MNGTAGKVRSDALAFFGATGDLAHKMVFPALYAMAKRGALRVPVIAVASSKWSPGRLRARIADSIGNSAAGIDDRRAFDQLLSLVRVVNGDFNSSSTFMALKQALDGARHPIHYLAIPPELFGKVVKGLGAAGLSAGSRVIFEKPFGRDLKEARQLNREVTSMLPESSIFRIDHFLGKEAIENLLYFRFANSFLEPIWNRNYIASVHITLAEASGIEGRGRIYDAIGCLRDVVQNHLLQVVTLLAMEPPVNMSSEALRNEKVKVFQAIRPLIPSDIVRGQFTGYHRVPNVAKGSDVETFCAVRLSIDSWRWAGVPWYLRSGKRLAQSGAEVWVELTPPPYGVFADSGPLTGQANYLRFQLEPGPAIALAARFKRAGKKFVGDQRELYLYDELPGAEAPYERLLGDAMAGDASLFARGDAVEAAWAVVDPVLSHHGRAFQYKPGTWGPVQADKLILAGTGWHQPVLGTPPSL